MEKHRYYDSKQERKVIFSIRMCEFLLNRGHKMIEFDEHRTDNKLIFVFENSNQLHYDIDEYLELKAKALI